MMDQATRQAHRARCAAQLATAERVYARYRDQMMPDIAAGARADLDWMRWALALMDAALATAQPADPALSPRAQLGGTPTLWETP